MRGGLSPSHIRRLGDMPTTVVMDPTSGRLFKFEEREEGGGGAEVDVARRRRRRRFVLDTTLFSERDSVQVSAGVGCWQATGGRVCGGRCLSGEVHWGLEDAHHPPPPGRLGR